jgi:hypothetical protein
LQQCQQLQLLQQVVWQMVVSCSSSSSSRWECSSSSLQWQQGLQGKGSNRLLGACKETASSSSSRQRPPQVLHHPQRRRRMLRRMGALSILMLEAHFTLGMWSFCAEAVAHCFMQ